MTIRSKGPSSIYSDERIKALHRYNILSGSTQTEFDNITKLARLICNVPIALISMVDDEKLFFTSIIGAEARPTPLEVSFSAHTLLAEGIVEVEDARLDERFKNHPAVAGDPFVRFYAGAPLIDEDGFHLGVIGVFDTVPKNLSEAQKEGLLTLASQVITHLSLKKRSFELDTETHRFQQLLNESKKAENELRKLAFVASKVNNAVVINDANNHVTWVNDAFEKITGFTLDDLKGKRLGDLISGPDTDLEVLNRVRDLSRQNKSFTVDLLSYRKDKQPMWLSIYNTVVLDEQGKVELEVEIIIDITEKKLAEKEMMEAKEQALQLSEAREMFVSVMSHEIRTPLNAIIGMTHLLLENDPRENQVDDLKILKFSGENLLHIINDILDFTKIETGNMHLEHIVFDLCALANDSISSLQVNAKRKEIALIKRYDVALPAMLIGDKTRLYQILMNLLSNSIKFTNEGQVSLHISLQEETETLCSVLFEIEDTGIGIPEDKLSYIFETFTQAKTDISREYGGTGLGLAITKKLLALHGSEIFVSSKEGVGSRFWFTIDFEKVSSSGSQKGILTEGLTFNDKKILVVDDNKINIMIATRIISKWGPAIDTATSGNEAIEKIRNTKYDLVFMDIKMPGINGFEATSVIRSLPGDYFARLPIIALTASSLHSDHSKFTESGMNGHLLKPFNPEELKAILSRFLS